MGAAATLLGGLLILYAGLRRNSSPPAASPPAGSTASSCSDSTLEAIAHISHEIRNPLAAVVGMAETLADQGLSEDDRQAALRTIVSGGRHLHQLLNDVLDHARLAAGRLEVSRCACRIRLLAGEVEAIHAPHARAKGLSLRAKIDPQIPEWIETDPTRLRQILINLVANAIKFTQRGGVEIRLIVASGDPPAHAGQILQIAVADTGIGMNERQLSALFTPFAQVGESAGRVGGAGLGLAISRRLALLLGGDITVASKIDAGTTFTVHIPLIPVAASANAVSIAHRRDGLNVPSLEIPGDDGRTRLDGLRILLVEDVAENQKLLSFLLERAGAIVTLAEDGRRAVELFTSADSARHLGRPAEAFDIVLMDVFMPTMNGLEATRLLRRLGYDRPIIALTGRSLAEDRRACIDAGCDDFLVKPIDRFLLIQHISGWMKKPRPNDSSRCHEAAHAVGHPGAPRRRPSRSDSRPEC